MIACNPDRASQAYVVANLEILMSVKFFKIAAAGAACAMLLAGCGGGGGDSGSAPAPVTPPGLTFELDAGYRALITGGANDNFAVSGTCSGTANITVNPANPSSFEGVAGFAAVQTATHSSSNCPTLTGTVTGTTYYNTSYVRIGLSIVGGEYDKFETPPAAFPATVVVGNNGPLATLIIYTNSSKTVAEGKRVISYEIKDGTLTTAVANIITRSFNQSNQLLTTEIDSYRIAQDGTLTLMSKDVQFSTTSQIHLLYTIS